ncbi:MAG: glycosyltransferase [Candidatus Hydrogenedentes bacterium]|nr:glycosyltransferase [Candidatus Hydrogenedentota bacterium]
MPTPRFSVLIPSYNRPELLVPTIESVLAQTLADFEVIVSDDASPRGAEIAAAVSRFRTDARFRFILQPKNLGWSDNRNALLKEATGEFVMLLGDDDLLPSHALACLGGHISVRSDSELIAFGYEVIDLDGRHTYSRHAPRQFSLEVGQGDGWREVFYYDVLPMWAFHPFTLCCRRALAVKLGYDKRCGIGDDVLFLFKALDGGGRIDVLPKVLFSWRRALQPINGYVNLSSSKVANDKARGAIWLLAQQGVWQNQAVRELLGSGDFARHFLSLPPGIAAQVAQLGRTGTSAALDEARTLWEKTLAERRWQAGKLAKLFRMCRIAGIAYAGLAIWSTFRRNSGTARSSAA